MAAKIQVITLCGLASLFWIMPTASCQALDCSTVSHASEYGTDLSVCQMPDQSRLRCTQDTGGLSHCRVEHANGFISEQNQQPGSAVQGLAMLISWMVRTHQEHVTDKAMQDASSTVLLTMKHTMHLMDMSALVERIAPSLPPDQKDVWAKLSKNLADQSSAFSGAVSLFTANWNSGTDRASFHREAKNLQKLYDSGLATVCGTRSASQILTGKLVPIRFQLQEKGPDGAKIVEALDAVIADENLLTPECASKRAGTALRKATN
jgi:hypothetical protein